LNISIVSRGSGLFELRSTLHDTNLGGGALDSLLVNYFVADFTKKNRGKDIKSNARAMAKLHTACERAKKTLSTIGQASVEVDGLYEGQDYNGNISRARFEDMASSHIKACLTSITRCIEEAKLTKQQITDIIMVGGGARIPVLQSALASFFEGKQITRSVNPEESIAVGAVQQGILGNSSVKKDLQMPVSTTALRNSIGLELGNGQMGVVLTKGSVIPAKKSILLATHEDNQEAFFLQVYEGDDPIPRNNTLLGRVCVGGIQPRPKGSEKVKIKLEIDCANMLVCLSFLCGIAVCT